MDGISVYTLKVCSFNINLCFKYIIHLILVKCEKERACLEHVDVSKALCVVTTDNMNDY